MKSFTKILVTPKSAAAGFLNCLEIQRQEIKNTVSDWLKSQFKKLLQRRYTKTRTPMAEMCGSAGGLRRKTNKKSELLPPDKNFLWQDSPNILNDPRIGIYKLRINTIIII